VFFNFLSLFSFASFALPSRPSRPAVRLRRDVQLDHDRDDAAAGGSGEALERPTQQPDAKVAKGSEDAKEYKGWEVLVPVPVFFNFLSLFSFASFALPSRPSRPAVRFRLFKP
jgi:hypothetical protein